MKTAVNTSNHSENKIHIFDTTLRDGQQSPGAGMTFAENLEFARKAADLGVDILEAGFPSASRLDFTIVEAIAKELAGMQNGPVICGLTQLRESQVLATIRALLPAQEYGKARVHIYLPVDPTLMEASLKEAGNDPNKLIRDVAKYVGMVVQAGMECEFSPEGYSNMGENFNFTTDVIRAAVAAGATIINCPDTRGKASPFEGENYFVLKMKLHAEIIKKEFPDANIVWSTHNHNDKGLAVINSLNAVVHGPARQIECTINGVGERAGNASLEEVVINLKCDLHDYHAGINTQKLVDISDFIAERMMIRQPNKAVTGDNAHRHTSGGHTNAVLANPTSYQAFDPALVGGKISLVFGPLSGSNHAQEVILKAGYVCEEDEKVAICQYIKDRYEDRRKGITDEELIAGYIEYRSPIQVKSGSIEYSKSSRGATCSFRGTFFDVKLDSHKTKHKFTSNSADSAIGPLMEAIQSKVPGLEIVDFSSQSASPGSHAESETNVTLTLNGKNYSAVVADKDIEKSAILAVIEAANQAYVDNFYVLKP